MTAIEHLCNKYISSLHNGILDTEYWSSALNMFWMCRHQTLKKETQFNMCKINTEQVRRGRQKNPAAFTHVAKLQRQSEKLTQSPLTRPPPWLPEHTHVPPIWLRHWGQTHHERQRVAPTQQSRLPSFIIPRFGGADQSIRLWCCRFDTHEVCGCAPFVHLITKAACDACWLQKQVVCSETQTKEKTRE